MKQLKISLMLIVLAAGFQIHRPAEAQIVVSNSVLGNGGDALSDGRYSMVGTVGETFIGVAQNLSSVNHVGFWYLPGQKLMTVEEQGEATAPTQYRLEQNYPNPFNPTTTIAFDVPALHQVELAVYDVIGRRVALLVDGVLAAGRHEATWQAGKLPSGTYFYRLTAGAFSQTKAMTLMK